MENNQNNHILRKYDIEARRKAVASMLARSMTESEISEKLGVDQTTVSRDVRFLKESAQRFIFDLARSDLAFFYRDCILGIEAVKQRAWEMADVGILTPKDRIAALRLAKDCDVERFKIFQDGPNMLNLKCLEDRVSTIETRNGSNGSGNQQPARTA